MPDHCRCGTCGRFTSHWRLDESFCRREECWTVYEGPYEIPDPHVGSLTIPPKAILCDECADDLAYENAMAHSLHL